MESRKKLADILRLNSDQNKLKDAWDRTAPADDFAPLPPGVYRCRVLSGELFNAKTGTPAVKLTFEVAQGDHEGRRVWHDVWLTDAAMPMTKRDLEKLGVTKLEQLEEPLPQGILADVTLALRKDDDGTERNRVKKFDMVGVEPGDAFEPTAGEDTTFDTVTFEVAAPPADQTKPRRVSKKSAAEPATNGEATT